MWVIAFNSQKSFNIVSRINLTWLALLRSLRVNVSTLQCTTLYGIPHTKVLRLLKKMQQWNILRVIFVASFITSFFCKRLIFFFGSQHSKFYHPYLHTFDLWCLVSFAIHDHTELVNSLLPEKSAVTSNHFFQSVKDFKDTPSYFLNFWR